MDRISCHRRHGLMRHVDASDVMQGANLDVVRSCRGLTYGEPIDPEVGQDRRRPRKGPCVMIVEHDLEYGIKLADWLAAHGYQAVLVRSMTTTNEEFRELRPQAVFIGLPPPAPVTTLALHRFFHTIETTSPHVPVVTMENRTSGNQADILNSGSLRHLHLPIKPTEFTYIGRLLRSELSAAAASPISSSTEPESFANRVVKNRAYAHTVHCKAATWIRQPVTVATASCTLLTRSIQST